MAEAKAKADVQADAKGVALEGGGVITPSSPANKDGSLPVSAVRGDNATALRMTTLATKWGDKDKDRLLIVVIVPRPMRTHPSPRGG